MENKSNSLVTRHLSHVTTIEGTLERITYQNSDSHYMVAKFSPKEEIFPITIVGNFLNLNSGGHYILEGEWVKHPKYGDQFKVVNFKELLPETLQGLEKYLSSGLIKGIGPVTAKRLVQYFKFDVLEIIEKQPEKLAQVSGIGPQTARKIGSCYIQQKETRKLVAFFSNYDIPPVLSLKIYNHYGKDTHYILQKNPYKLAEDIWGIGFKTADRIAQSTGIKADSPQRIAAGLFHTLKTASEHGHLYLPENELINQAAEILQVDSKKVKIVLEKLILEKQLILDNEDVYLASFYAIEKKIADRVSKFMQIPRLIDLSSERLKSYLQQLPISLACEQLKAVEYAFSSGILILTGGPGTGKTTTVKSILQLADLFKLKTVLAAPTGRAAKRLSETTNHQAKTIHRLLEYHPMLHTFQRNETNPIKADLFIIDEASMIDVFLFQALLQAIPEKAHLVLVGDVDQLPSVGPGNILRDLISSEKIKTIYLKKIFRQAADSFIIVNSHKINQGLPPVFKSPKNDFFFLNIQDPEEISQNIISLAAKKVKDKFGFNPLKDIQVLSPMHKGTIGVSYLNKQLQNILNPPSALKPEIEIPWGKLRQGDKIMQIKNNYEKGVFNGDLGNISSIDLESQEIEVDFLNGENSVKYEFFELNELVLAYACSIHKSQGSEYPVVIIPVATQHYIMLQRNLIYTAITRARNLVILVGTKKALMIAIKNDKLEKRYTKLAQRIKQISSCKNLIFKQ